MVIIGQWCDFVCQVVVVAVNVSHVCHIIRIVLLVEAVTTLFQRKIDRNYVHLTETSCGYCDWSYVSDKGRIRLHVHLNISHAFNIILNLFQGPVLAHWEWNPVKLTIIWFGHLLSYLREIPNSGGSVRPAGMMASQSNLGLRKKLTRNHTWKSHFWSSPKSLPYQPREERTADTCGSTKSNTLIKKESRWLTMKHWTKMVKSLANLWPLKVLCSAFGYFCCIYTVKIDSWINWFDIAFAFLIARTQCTKKSLHHIYSGNFFFATSH